MRRWRYILPGMLIGAQIAIAADAPAPRHKSLYDYSLVSLDGNVVPLSGYKGKVVLIVNLASKSIYNRQIAALNELQKTYADKGLIVVGIPSTDFGAEELTDNAAIQKYYQESAHAGFKVFSKACLRGKDAIPLVRFLTDPKDGVTGGDIHWNFTKFLVDREGTPLVRFESDSEPFDAEFRLKVEQVLDGTYKKKDAKDTGATAQDGDEDD